MMRHRYLHLDRSPPEHTRATCLLLLVLGAGMLACGLSGCVRYSSNRDHLEREALVLSPTDDASGGATTRPSVGVRN